MAVTSISPKPQALATDFSLDELETKLIDFNRRKPSLSAPEQAELLRLEGIVQVKRMYKDLSKAEGVSPASAKKYEKLAAQLESTELTKAKFAKVADMQVDPDWEKQLFPNENADPSEHELPIGSSNNFAGESKTAPAQLHPPPTLETIPKTQIYPAEQVDAMVQASANITSTVQIPILPQKEGPSFPPIQKTPIKSGLEELPKSGIKEFTPVASNEPHTDSDSLITLNGLPPENHIHPKNAPQEEIAEEDDESLDPEEIVSKEEDPAFYNTTDSMLTAIMDQFQMKKVVIPAANDDPQSLLACYDRYYLRQYSQPEYPTELIVQIIMVKIVHLTGKTEVDGKGMRYYPVQITNKEEIAELKQSFLSRPISKFHEFNTQIEKVEQMHNTAAITAVAGCLRQFLPRLAIKQTSNGDIFYLGRKRIHLDITALFVFAHPPPKPANAPLYFGLSKAQVYFTGQDQLEDYIRFRVQKNELLLTHNKLVAEKRIDQAAILQFYKRRSVCALMSVVFTFGMIIVALAGLIYPWSFILGGTSLGAFGYYWVYSARFMRQLRVFQSQWLFWGTRHLNATQCQQICALTENEGMISQIRFEQGIPTQDKTAIFRKPNNTTQNDATPEKSKSKLHSTYEYTTQKIDQLKIQHTAKQNKSRPHSSSHTKIQSKDTVSIAKPKPSIVATKNFHKEDSINSFLEE